MIMLRSFLWPKHHRKVETAFKKAHAFLMNLMKEIPLANHWHIYSTNAEQQAD